MRRGLARTVAVVVPVVGALLLVAAVWHLPFAGWVGHNGDHMYYASMALQFAGHGYTESLQATADYFHYPRPASVLDYGYLNPQFAPLVYPRTALPLAAAPFVSRLGVAGVWVPGAVCGTATVVTLVAICWRRLGRTAAVGCAALALLSMMVTEFGFGIYTESIVMLVMTCLILVMPYGRTAWHWPHLVTTTALVALLVFVRQVVIVPAAIVLVGWVYGLVRSRRWRNEWAPYVLVVALVTAATTALSDVWAPYNPFLFLESALHVETVGQVLPLVPGRFWSAMTVDATQAWATDRAAFLILALALVGGWVLRRTAWPWTALAALLAGLVTTALNGVPTGFRYLTPAMPLLLVLAAAGFATVCRALVRLLDRRSVRPGVTERPAGTRRVGSVLGAVAAVVTLGLVTAGTVVVYQAAPVDAPGVSSAYVSSSDFKGYWPIVDHAGTLVCVGDDAQVWFRSSEGQLYAFSGTAMARSLRAPRLQSRAIGGVTFSWPQAGALLARGVGLCRQQ